MIPSFRSVRTPSSLLLAVALVLALLPQIAAANGICTGTSADASIDYIYQPNGPDDPLLYVEGDWKTYGASSARLRYYVDGTLYQTSYLSGTQGAWNPWVFEDDVDACDTPTFKVQVCPRVYDNGGYTICETHCDEASQYYIADDCPDPLNVSFDCDSTGPTGVVSMSATITSGNPPYKVEKYFPNSWHTTQSSTYSTTHYDGGRCSLTTYRAGIRITDDEDNVKSLYCWCDAPW